MEDADKSRIGMDLETDLTVGNAVHIMVIEVEEVTRIIVITMAEITDQGIAIMGTNEEIKGICYLTNLYA